LKILAVCIAGGISGADLGVPFFPVKKPYVKKTKYLLELAIRLVAAN
jgi:hypothetical protein